jgi:hypothetical protein
MLRKSIVAALLLNVRLLAAPAPEPSRALLDQYCVTCHNQRTKTAGLMLDQLDPAHAPANAESWEKVIRKLRGRLMPPAGRPRPEDANIDAFVASLETSIDRAASVVDNPGAVPLHRLNRTEYGNAIRDILDLRDTDVAALLPSDDDSDGFDNVASVLKESPAFIEGYIGAAREAARLAVGDVTAGASASVYRMPAGAIQLSHVDGMPLGTRGGVLVRRYFPLDGEYKFDITLRQYQFYVRGLEFPHTLVVLVDGVKVFERSLGGEADLKAQDQGLAAASAQIQARFKNLRVPVKAGPHAVVVTFIARTFAESDEVLQGFFRDINVSNNMNGVPVLEKFEITGPFAATGAGDTPSRRKIFSCRPAGASDETACAKKILAPIARRAFRRPIGDADLVMPMKFFGSGRAKGDFDKGIQTAISYILSSPKFLYRAEQDLPGTSAAHRVSDLELASRLSFFLWSSVPDDELVDVAAAGKLSTPATLERQVRRMLADRKADALVTNFFAQWLRVRELAQVDPDSSEFPNFEEELRDAFRKEMELFTGSIVREDRSLLDLLNARDTFVNERLALHYGIPGVRGDQFRRVTLADENRWGVLGKGSLLTVTSYGNRTSPVLRGRWVLEGILGTPPPTPPPNVPPLKENVAGGAQLSVRQLLEQHRSTPTCASCHAMIDPPGFALENYDAVGQWRDQDHGVAVEPFGKLADGSDVDSPAALRRALAKRPDQFLLTATEKLLTYALGRSVTYTDMPTVRAVVRTASDSNYRFSSVVMAIVKSHAFQMRSPNPEPGTRN